MIHSYYLGRSQNISDLRASSKVALSLPEFRNIRWIGVFGSFSRDQQGDRSDVDIIVVEKSGKEVGLEGTAEDGGNNTNPDAWTLEDLLPRVWCRPVDIVRIEKQELRGLVSMDAILTARTLYGNDQSQEILKLRQDAKNYLEEGWSIFKKVEEEIHTLKSKVEGMGSFEEFSESSSSFKQSIREDLLHIIQGFDIQPVWHPIHEGFWSAVIQPANELKIIITANQEGTEYWKGIWDILSTSAPKSLQSILTRLKKFVYPTLTDIEARIKRSESLERQENMEQLVVASAVEIAENENQISAVVQSEEAAETRMRSVEPPAERVVKEGRFKRRLKRLKARLGL